MFENKTQYIKNALGGVFDRVLDLFDELKMPEHRNELLCFVGIDGYRLSEAVYGSESPGRKAEAKYLVRALGKRNMTADELTQLFDSKAIPALLGCGLTFDEIKRTSCVYLKEHGCYCVSAELKASSFEPTEEAVKSLSFLIDGHAFLGMNGYEIAASVKTAVTPTIGSGIISRAVGKMPLKINVMGEVSASLASELYSSLYGYLGLACTNVSVGGNVFTGMYMTGLEMSAGTDGLTKLTVSFTEVNGI